MCANAPLATFTNGFNVLRMREDLSDLTKNHDLPNLASDNREIPQNDYDSAQLLVKLPYPDEILIKKAAWPKLAHWPLGASNSNSPCTH